MTTALFIPLTLATNKLVWRGNELPKLSDQSPLQSSLPFIYVGLVVLGVILAISVLTRALRHVKVRSPIVRSSKPERGQPRPAVSVTAFKEAAGKLGVRRSDQRLLTKIARGAGLASPITLLVSPATLRHHALVFTTGMLQVRRDRLMERVTNLSRSLFDEQERREVLADVR